jgi:hypothetical protein
MDETQPEKWPRANTNTRWKFGDALERWMVLPKIFANRSAIALDGLQRDFRGDIKKLKGYKDEYRLRVGSYFAFSLD